MSVQDLSDSDFSHWRDKLDRMRSCHENEFLAECDADLMRAFYRGYKSKEYKQYLRDPLRRQKHEVTFTRIFTATNTVRPNLYYENPKVIAISKHGSDPFSAALLTSGLNYFMRELRQKEENQTAIMNAYFFGLGWKKIGYHVRTEEEGAHLAGAGEEEGSSPAPGRAPAPQTEPGGVPPVFQYETLFNTSESPINVILDDKGTWQKFKVICHRAERSLFDLRTTGVYDEEGLKKIYEEKKYQHGSRFDERDVWITLNELMIEMREGVWILAFPDDVQNAPLRYERSLNQGKIPWAPIVFTNEPDVRYPVSHMKVGSQAQHWVDNIATMQLDIIGKARNQTAIWEDALSDGQELALRRNLIGGIVKFKKPLSPQVFQALGSMPMTADFFQMLALAQQNVTEVMGADEQRVSGKSKNRTLGQDELATIGTQIREGGMLDRVREWLILQKKIETELLQQFASSELRLSVAPMDFFNPRDAQGINLPAHLEFMTLRNPTPYKQFIQGHFDHEINVYEAVKPDKKMLAREYDELMALYANPMIQQAMLQLGKRVRIDLIAQKRGETMEYVNAREFIEDLDSMQMAALQVTNLMSDGAGVGRLAMSPRPAFSSKNPEAEGEATRAKAQEEALVAR